MRPWIVVATVAGVVVIALACYLLLVVQPAQRRALDKALWEAVEGGDFDTARRLLERGANPNSEGRSSACPPLHEGAQQQREDLVALLLEHGADVNARDEPNGWSPLYLAILMADEHEIATAALLLEHGADPNARDSDEDLTPLHCASRQCHCDAVKLLLDHGADPNARSRRTGETPLHLVMRYRLEGAVATARLLLDHGAHVNAKDSLGASPLFEACLSEPGTRSEMTDLLISYGARVTLLDRTLLGEWEVALNELRADPSLVSAAGGNGLTPLHVAVACGDAGSVEALIDLGADTDAKDSWDRTPLLVMDHPYDRRVAELVLEAGADINAHDDFGSTLLHQVAESACVARDARFLIERRADIHARNRRGETPLDVAVSTWFLNTGADRPDSPDRPGREVALTLLAWGAMPAPLTKHEITREHPSVVDLLVACGVNYTGTDRIGYLPLHHTVASGEKGVVELLIEHGADVNTPTSQGDCPLHIAARNGDAALVEYLLSKGADTTAANDVGETPLGCATDHPDVLELLGRDGSY